MNQIAFKTVDGIIYTGEITYFGKEELSVKNLSLQNGAEKDQIPNLKDSSYGYKGEVWFYTNKIIWYSKNR